MIPQLWSNLTASSVDILHFHQVLIGFLVIDYQVFSNHAKVVYIISLHLSHSYLVAEILKFAQIASSPPRR